MKQWAVKCLRRCWKAASFLHGPLARRFDRHLEQALVAAAPRLEQALAGGYTQGASATAAGPPVHEVSLALDGVVREVGRLQIQIEMLEIAVRQRAGTAADRRAA